MAIKLRYPIVDKYGVFTRNLDSSYIITFVNIRSYTMSCRTTLQLGDGTRKGIIKYPKTPLAGISISDL